MGEWGAGLYSGDFAADLRSAVSAVARLPLEPDELVRALIDTEPAAANHAGDPDHTTFWLILADQFARRGIVSKPAHERALAILESGADLAMRQKLGMNGA